MRLAMAAYYNRVASLFEASDRFEIVDIEGGGIGERKSVAITNNEVLAMVELLKEHHVGVLICGAISGCTFQAVEFSSIKVFPWVTGEMEKVLSAYLAGTMDSCLMPGCMGRHGRRMGRSGGRRGFRNMIH
ncbi:MAG: NifB/NifX family molybdenum-iron cluster-binding protein [Candidatus Zhuqueibacterota bacterium]